VIVTALIGPSSIEAFPMRSSARPATPGSLLWKKNRGTMHRQDNVRRQGVTAAASSVVLAASESSDTANAMDQKASVLQGLVLPASVAGLFGTVSLAVRTALLSPHTYGPFGGLGALAAVASLVLIPLTQIRNLYAISVGYGLSVGVLGMLLRRTFDPLKESLGHTLSGCTVFYGFRLAAYLYTRERAGWKPSSTASRKEPSRLRRVPFSITLAFFYACLTMPVLHVLRTSPSLTYQSWQWYVAWTGTVVAWSGAVLEAVADTHKFMVKNNNSEGYDEFVGPVSGVYALTRHPNYTGEVLHWFGTYLAGTVCFGKSYVGWISSSLGLYGIVSIMVAATKGLEKRQQEKYLGDPAYENWKATVRYPLVPFLRGPTPVPPELAPPSSSS
jgi:steroid 5-alpha reductase family enzyme